jgi:hypothetical protein
MPTEKDINEFVGTLSRAWLDDWGIIFKGIAERCNISVNTVIAFHMAMAIQKLADSHSRILELQKELVPRQQKIIEYIEREMDE